MYLKGQSFGWSRFFIYAIPFSFTALISINFLGNRLQQIGLIFSLFLGSTIITYNSFITIEFHPFLDSSCNFENLDSVISFIKSNNLKDILVDAFYGYSIILRSGNPKLFIDSYDDNFTKALENPYNYSKYIIAFDALNMPDMLLQKYPSLAKIGRPEVTLLKDFNGVRIYRIDKPFKRGIFTIENISVSENKLFFHLQNYDTPQKDIYINTKCVEPKNISIEFPLHIENMTILEGMYITLPWIPSCKKELLTVRGFNYSIEREIIYNPNTSSSSSIKGFSSS